MGQNILLLGATSSIARALAEQLIKQGDNPILASRDLEELTSIATDFQIRFTTKIDYTRFDSVDLSSHLEFWQQLLKKMARIDGVIYAIGDMGETNKNLDVTEELKIINTNFTGAVSILNHCANYFAAEKRGFIFVIGSVAGDRGRQSNYPYGAAKAGLTVYLQGLRNKLFAKNVRVITIKLGIVDTAMTFSLPYPKFLATKPETVAKQMVKVLHKGQDEVYLPFFWRYIMWIIKLIPEKIFKRLKL